MRILLVPLLSALLLAGCAWGPEESGPAESTGTGDEGIGSSGVDGTGAGDDVVTDCPDLETSAQLVTREEANETACPPDA